MTELELHRPLNSPVVTASTGSDKLRESAQIMVMAKQIADAVCNTNMMPKHLRGKPDETAAVMLYGATLGLDPMQSVRSIYEVHGQPGLYARTMDALAKAAGHETWTVSSTDESVTVAGKRRGSDHVEEITWTIDRAIRAEYVPTIDPETNSFRLNKWGKVIGNEKYLTDPQAMLYAKAVAELCRKIAPDVLSGVYAVEELQSEQRFTIEQVPTPQRGLGAVLKPSGSEAVSQSGPEPGPDSADLPSSVSSPSEPEAPSAEPEELDLITKAQLAKIGAGMKALGIEGRDEALGYVHTAIGRQVESRNDLTKVEASTLIEKIDADVELLKGEEPSA